MPTTVSKRVTATAAGGQTSRVSAAATGSTRTSRIHHLFLLEGDESGYLLLEGDMQSGTDKLKLEGDATAITETSTKRVAEAVE